MTNSPASSSESSSFSLLDPRIQRWIWSAGWTELRDAQERAIPLILNGDQDVIIVRLASWFGPLRRFNLAHPWTLKVRRLEFRSAGA
jgi:hypothetical protein